jgi:hypothetical protein
MPSPRNPTSIAIHRTYGHAPDRAVELLARLLARSAAQNEATIEGGNPAVAAEGDHDREHTRPAIPHSA